VEMRARRPAKLLALVLFAAVAGCDGDGSGAERASRPAGKDGCAPWRATSSVPDLFRSGTARVCKLSVDGAARQYVVFEPRGLGSAPAPVVIALHGVGAGASPQSTAESSRLDSLAGRERFVAVYGEGVDAGWEPARDATYFAGAVDHLARRRAVDRDRVYAVGWSAGGYMAHQLACRISGRVAAIAALHAPLRGPCRPERPVSVLQMVGTADRVIPVAGGTNTLGEDSPPVSRATARWRRIDGCGGVERSSSGPLLREVATGCEDGTAVELLRIPGAGHTWFGGQGTSLPDDALDATAEAWRFFAAHPRR
jgi:polyhydroxybutyrate depolymerase